MMQNGLDGEMSDDEDHHIPIDKRLRCGLGDKVLVFEGNSEHAASTLTRLNTLRRGGQFCDVVMEVGGSTLSAHRAILATASSYLLEMFSSEENGVDHFKVDGVDFESFDILVNFIYTLRLEAPADHIKDVYRAATLLKIPEAAQACSKYLALYLTPDNCLGTRAFANSYSDAELTTTTDSFIQEHIDLVAKSSDYQKLKSFRVDILGVSELEMVGSGGQHLCELVMEYVKACVNDDEVGLEELAKHVHKLFLGVDNTLRDCGDVEDLAFSSIGEVQDYKQLNKKRQPSSHGRPLVKVHSDSQISSKGQRATGKEKGSPPPVGNLQCQSMDRLAAIARQWSLITTKNVSERCIMAIAIFEDTMVRLSLNLRGLPSTNGYASDRDPTPNTSPRSSVSCMEKQVSLTPLAAMSSARCAVGTGVMQGKLIALGGYDRGECMDTVEAFDLAKNTWSKLPSMLSPRGRFDVSQYKGHLYACGGSNGQHELRSAEFYDVDAGKWEAMDDMLAMRSYAGVAILDGKLYVIGGWSGQRGMADCEMFDLREPKGRWKRIPSMQKARSQAGTCSLNGLLLAVGGSDAWTTMNTVEAFNPAENRWTTLPSMNTCRRGAGVAVFKGKIYVIGGSDGTSVQVTTEVYDPVSQSWSSGPNLSTPRANVGVAVVENRLFAVGGFSGKAFLDSIEYLATDASEWCSYIPIVPAPSPLKQQQQPTISVTTPVEEENE